MTALNSVKERKVTTKEVREEYEAFGRECAASCGNSQYHKDYIIGGMIAEIVMLRNSLKGVLK